MIDHLLHQIRSFTHQKRLTRFEKKRLERELAAVFDRLRKKEYQKGGFTTNTFDVPDRTREFFIYMEFYCLVGRTWAAVLKEFGIHRFSEVVDVCPGYAPKIELALFYLDFRGKLIVMDRDSDATKELENFMSLFQPRYSMERRRVNVFGIYRSRHEVILANHIIDDLVMHYFAEKFHISRVDIYEKEGVYKDLWGKILQNREQSFGEMLSTISRLFRKIVKRNGWLIMAHYKSYMEKLLDMNAATAFNRKLFLAIVNQLCQEGFVKYDEIPRRAFRKFRGHFGPRDCVVLQKKH